MSFNKAPSSWLGAGYVGDSSNHKISLNTNDAPTNKTLPNLTDVLADASTGDIRDVALALVDALYQAWQATTAGDRPAMMSISRSQRSGSGGNPIVTYSLQFTLVVPTAGSLSIQAE